MSDMTRFMKKYQIRQEDTTYPATKSLVDEKGEPLLWEIKPIDTRTNDELIDACSYDVQITGKPGMFRTKVDQIKYKAMLVAASVTYPNLRDTELQDSYGVVNEIDLVREMIPSAGEFAQFVEFVNNFNGFTPMQEAVDEAKN